MSATGIQHNSGGEPDKGLRETISKMLKENFGTDTVTGLPMWRVSWSEDQFERRLGTYDDFTPAGIYLRTVTEVREVPKYRQWITRKYVLENLVGIPVQNQKELPNSKMSYEPLWVFEDGQGNALPPSFEASQFVINAMNAAKGGQSLRKYVDENAEAQSSNGKDARIDKVNKLTEELFGDESGLGGAIVHGEGVAGFYPDGKASKAN